MNDHLGHLLGGASLAAAALMPAPSFAQDFTASAAAPGPAGARAITPGRLWIRPYEPPVNWVFPAWQSLVPFAPLSFGAPLAGPAPSGANTLNTGGFSFGPTGGSGNNNGNGNVGSNNGNGNETNGNGNFGVGDNRGNGNANFAAE